MTRADVLAMHEEWMLLGGGRRLLEKRLRKLEGEVLGCRITVDGNGGRCGTQAGGRLRGALRGKR